MKTVKKASSKSTVTQIQALRKELAYHEAKAARIGVKLKMLGKSAPAKTAGKLNSDHATHPRRSFEEMKKRAGEMVIFIKSKGEDGATAGEIKRKFGNVLPSIKEFINKNGYMRVKTAGKGDKTVYHTAQLQDFLSQH